MHKINKSRRSPQERRRKRRYPMPPLVVYLPHARAFAGGEDMDFWDNPQPCDLASAEQLDLGWGMQFVCPVPEGGVLMMLPAARRMVRVGAYEAYLEYAVRDDAPQGTTGGDPLIEDGDEDAEYVALAGLSQGIVNEFPSDDELQAIRRERRSKKRKALNRWRRRSAHSVARKLKSKAG